MAHRVNTLHGTIKKAPFCLPEKRFEIKKNLEVLGKMENLLYVQDIRLSHLFENRLFLLIREEMSQTKKKYPIALFRLLTEELGNFRDPFFLADSANRIS